MTNPPTKPVSDLAPSDDALPDDDAPFREPTEEEWAEVDAWTERNKDALNESIRQAREQFARGEFFTHEEVWARVRATIKKYARKP